MDVTEGQAAVPGSLLTTMPAFKGVVLWYLHGSEQPSATACTFSGIHGLRGWQRADVQPLSTSTANDTPFNTSQFVGVHWECKVQGITFSLGGPCD